MDFFDNLFDLVEDPLNPLTYLIFDDVTKEDDDSDHTE